MAREQPGAGVGGRELNARPVHDADHEGRAELHAATQDQIERARAETIPAPQED